MNPSKLKILEKSFHLFLTRSYDSVSMKDIQNEVELSRGAIYHHFTSKEEIYEEVLDKYLLPAFSSYTTIVPETDNTNITLMEAIQSSIKSRQAHSDLLKKVVSFKLVDFYFFKFIFQATEHSKTFKEKTNLLVEKEFNTWRLIIQSAMRKGEIRPDIDVDSIAQWFIISPMGLGMSAAFTSYVNNINSNDLRSVYLRYYNLLKKQSFM